MLKTEYKLTFEEWVNKERAERRIIEINKQNYKFISFEYFVYKIIMWWKEENIGKDFNEHNDFSVLKVMLILFFVSSADAKDGDNNTLLETFDNWHARPYGPVEQDIFTRIQNNPDFGWFEFDKKNHKMILKNNN